MLYLLILSATADTLYYNDYTNNEQYDWSSLQEQSEYTIDLGSETIHFSLGSNLKSTCKGETAAVIKFSRPNNDCTILGKHEFSSHSAFTALNNPGIDVYYKEGSPCKDGKNRKWTEFRFFCSQEEHDFSIWSVSEECRTVIQKYSVVGCPKSIFKSFMGKSFFFAFFGVCVIVVFYGIVEDCGGGDSGKGESGDMGESKKLIVKIRGKDRKIVNMDEKHIYL